MVWSGCCSNPKVAPYMHSHRVSKKYFLNFNFMYFFAVLVSNILNVHDMIFFRNDICVVSELDWNIIVLHSNFMSLHYCNLLILLQSLFHMECCHLVDGKPKAIYLLYGDEIGRRAGHPEYMMPMSLMRVIHKDSSHSLTIDNIWKNMMIKQDPQKSKHNVRLTSFSNFLEGKFVLKTRNWRLNIATTNA